MSAEEAVEEKSRQRRKRRDDDEFDESEERGVSGRKGRATRSRRETDDAVDAGGNFITRGFGGIRGYLRGVRDELDKVVWPSREETIRLSRIVLAATAASAVVLGIVSFAFTELFVVGIRQDKPIVFVLAGLAVVVAYFGVRRFNSRNTINPPY